MSLCLPLHPHVVTANDFWAGRLDAEFQRWRGGAICSIHSPQELMGKLFERLRMGVRGGRSRWSLQK